ncbi:MAG: 16S rRNA (cytidine(1402)-2'-O)-methyltransferase [Solirubrobacteraceae bacterium]|nr:16S rRNA (cytidine(1402)-2'-O)-methyltransferase [Solirubrobacteraceae bacterium]
MAHAPAPAAGRLTLCPTPIGNLADCPPRVAAALLDADLVLCEDTRRTGKLLQHLAAEAGRDGRPPMKQLHDHNERGQVEGLVAQLTAGLRAALCSDAGTPLVSDPGLSLVRGCLEAGVTVESLPGPSAVLVALSASGMASDRWRFVGFAPRKADAAAQVLLDEETTVAFEAPGRVAATLAAIAAVDPEREVAVARELTKLHEEIVRGPAAVLAERYAGAPPKGEVTLVVAGAAREVDDAAAVEAVERLVAAGARTKDAAAVVADLTGARTNALYRAVQARR